LSACALKNQLDLSPHGADAAVGEIAVQEAPCINWAGAALLILALTLFLLEAKIASHGILGTGGTVAMVLGAVLLINGPPEVRIHLKTALAVSVPFALITIFLMTLVIRSRTARIAVGEPALINLLAQARTALAPAGTVFVHGEYWDAVSTVPVEQGDQVRVVGIDGMRLRVEPVSSAAQRD
jgi:membrane-bound serine protease (ClpP class)